MRIVPWDMPAGELERVHRGLRFDYFKWDLYASGRCLLLPASIVLSEAEHERAVAVAERFAAILARLEGAIVGRAELLRRLGIPAAVIPLLTREQPVDLQLARYDLFPASDGRWMVCEFNEDVPGGFNEAVGLPALLGGAVNGAAFRGDLRRAVTDALAPYRRVAMLHATGYSEDLQHMLIVQRWLEEAGHETRLGSPSHLRGGWGGPRVLGGGCDAAFRFYPGEWFGWLENRETWLGELPRLPMMNPVRRLIRQSKRLYAVWREPGLLGDDDLAFLDEHAPATLGFDTEEAREGAGRREGWVLKHAFGRMGDAVIMGNLASDRQWSEAVSDASREPRGWLLQRLFDAATVPHELADRAGPLYPALGVYLVNGRFAGYYSRAAGQPFINHEAYHVATLVERA